MALYVKKFGGSSVATPDKMRHIASRVLREKKPEDQVVVVVSAMGDTTDNLLKLASQVTTRHFGRDMDMLITTGEQVSIALMAMTFQEMGVPAVCLTGPQAGIVAKGAFGKGSIIAVNPERVKKELDAGNIVVVAGFQAATPEGDIITLGRGGSDTTAVALAGAMKGICEIYTDVDGVYSADPRIAPEAVKLKEITNSEMLEMARLGAGVMQAKSVEMGSRFHIPIHVRSTFTEDEGTIIHDCYSNPVLSPVVCGVAHDLNVARIAVLGLNNVPGVAFMLFSELAAGNVDVDMIVQSVRQTDDAKTDIIFTCTLEDLGEARRILEQMKSEGKIHQVIYDTNCAKVSIVGAGMLGTPGVAARTFGALGKANVNIDIVSTSEISISCLIQKDRVKDAVRAIHAEFFKDKPE
jgi:aspartate kinase